MIQQSRTNSPVHQNASALQEASISRSISADCILPPNWAYQWSNPSLVSGEINHLHASTKALPPTTIETSLRHNHKAALASVTLPNAGRLDAIQFKLATIAAFAETRKLIESFGFEYPVRFWNFLPDIHRTIFSDGIAHDWYMLFNECRDLAFKDWLHPAINREKHNGNFKPTPAASGVGHTGPELAIHCLAMKRPGQSIENPRQIPSIRYSHRYGPKPPNFARATLVSHPDFDHQQLLVAGTASICGEQSMHADNLSRQIDETIANLQSLVATAANKSVVLPLSAFTSLRVYHRYESDRELISQSLQNYFQPHSPAIEYLRADICRKELLVEIEGLAELSEL